MSHRWTAFSLMLGFSLLLVGCSSIQTPSAASGSSHSTTASCLSKSPPLAPVKETVSQTVLNRYHSQQWKVSPAMTLQKSRTYVADVYTTDGAFSIELFSKIAPIAVNNFIFLAKHHFYDGDSFFRIVKGYMVQTGDPKQNGTGGPGYTWPDELPPHYAYTQGIVAMANRGPNTNGSQFFIVTAKDAQILDQNPDYTQFGRVLHGMAVVLKISEARVTYNPLMGEMSKPVKPIQIVRIAIRSC